MATTRGQIVAEALRWIGTPFHDKACVLGVGVDCVMLLYGVALAVGLVPDGYKVPLYHQQYHLHQDVPLLQNILTSLGCVLVPFLERQPGDIAVFQFDGTRIPAHAGILTAPDSLVHAIFGDAVRQHGLRGLWRTRLVEVRTFPWMVER